MLAGLVRCQAEVITCRQLERTKILVVAIFVTHVSVRTTAQTPPRKKMRARARILAVELKEAENNPGLYGLPGYAPRTYSFATSMNMFPKTP